MNWNQAVTGHHTPQVMTTFLARGRILIDFDRHMLRLQNHLNICKYDVSLAIGQIKFEIDTLLSELSPLGDRRCQVVFKHQLGGIAVHRVTVSPIPEKFDDLKAAGVALPIEWDSERPRGGHIKMGLAPPGSSADEVLWVNGDGELTEATWANIFLLGRTGDLLEVATPPTSSGLLAGVTRERVIDLLTSAKIPVTERVIYYDEIPRFDEAFLTSSIRGLVPIKSIGRHRLHSTRGHAVYHLFARLYGTWLQTLDELDGAGHKKIELLL